MVERTIESENRQGSMAVADSTEGDTREFGRSGGGEPDYAPLLDRLRATFRSGRTKDLAWRRRQLENLLRLLDDHEDELNRALHDDLRRPPFEAYAGDIGNTKGEIKHLLKHFARWARPTKVRPPLSHQPATARIIAEPLGVGLIISPWNYPIHLLLAPLAAALAAGNCAVVKPSELAPASSALLARLLPRYLDTDAVAIVEGAVPETTALLELAFDHIFFTGSTAVGRVVMEAAARHLTPVVLELGGKSPTIVAADADLDVTAHRIVFGKHLNAGQTCIAPDYVLVEASVRDQLVEKMTAVITDFASATQESPDYCRIVNDRHFGRLRGLLESSGGTIATGGTLDPATRFVPPTIIVDPDRDAPLMQEEIFGPLLPVLTVDSVDEAIQFVNDRPKPLALYIFSSSSDTADRVLNETSSGGACVNHTLLHQTLSDLPFGGVGPSGMGAYHGRAGFEAYSHRKSVLDKSTRLDPPMLYPPYNSLKERIVKAAL